MALGLRANMIGERWWTRRWFIICMVVGSAVPLLWPAVPPLVDVPGHMARFRVELDLASSPHLQRYFAFQWQVIGNLGTDLLIIPVARLAGLEFGVKLLVICIPVLTTLGIFLVSREIHGAIPPATIFAVPFVYGYPFNFGFINFALSMAFALLAFALWLRLSRDGRVCARAFLFVPISCCVWLTHAFGWGVLGLLAWSAEFVRQRDRKIGSLNALMSASIACLPLCIPFLLIIVWRGQDAGGMTTGYFNIGLKILSLFSALRDRWLLWDSFSVAAALILLASALFDRHLEISRRLAIPAAVLAAVFVMLPYKVFGSAYADARLIPYILMLALMALRLRPTTESEVARRVALVGCLCVGLRIAGNTLSFASADAENEAQLAALRYIPEGAPVATLVGDSCGKTWPLPRYSHLASFVILRKSGFSNDQWQLPGAQLLRVVYPAAGDFAADPSEMTIDLECKSRIIAKNKNRRSVAISFTADEVLERLPRTAFDYIWLINPVGFTPKTRAGLELLWVGPNSYLYRVTHGQRSSTLGALPTKTPAAAATAIHPGMRAAFRPEGVLGPPPS
jgi:hypothetical protein